jgi:hypothetical protein
MIPPSPILLIGAANAFVALGENRRGPPREGLVDALLREVGAPRDKWSRPRWDAALVHHAGYWSHFDPRGRVSSWPLPPIVTCCTLRAFAQKQRVICRDPSPGDLFLLWSPAKRTCVRTGVVVSVEGRGQFTSGREWVECVVIEGCTDPERTLGGSSTLRHLRKFCVSRGDRFVRWTELDVRNRSVAPVAAADEPEHQVQELRELPDEEQDPLRPAA